MFKINRSIVLIVLLIFSSACNGKNYNNKKEEYINVLYAADSKFSIPLCVSIASLVKNIKKDKILNIYIADLGLTAEDISKIYRLKKIKDFNIRFLKFDKSMIKGIDCYYWTAAVYVKCYAQVLLPDVNKCLWLDSDTIILKDISEMYFKTNLDGYYFAGITYLPSTLVDSDSHKKGKVNGGVLLMNLDKMRKENFSDQVISTVKQNQMRIKQFTEESAITLVGKNKSILLPFRYNIYPRFAHFRNEPKAHSVYYPVEEVENAVIYHYGGAMRPWAIQRDEWIKKGRSERIYDAWYYYYKMTPYFKN